MRKLKVYELQIGYQYLTSKPNLWFFTLMDHHTPYRGLPSQSPTNCNGLDEGLEARKAGNSLNLVTTGDSCLLEELLQIIGAITPISTVVTFLPISFFIQGGLQSRQIQIFPFENLRYHTAQIISTGRK